MVWDGGYDQRNISGRYVKQNRVLERKLCAQIQKPEMFKSLEGLLLAKLGD